ncbi:uncharacterized protein LOC134276127 [Saccostrea cucullata]|uniref:uncharacterized protein LOC134276127 n=1 Tax=Saccostrea cuccullata TaxID=36930 RepID=UPI002ED522E3
MANAGQPIVYLTFSNKSKRHAHEIFKLCEELEDSLYFSVKCDTFNYNALQNPELINFNGWRDQIYEKARWIFFRISPEYSNTLKAGEGNIPMAQINEHDQGIIYIHNVAKAEFRQNSIRDHRLIPLLFTKTNASVHDIPPFLRSSPYFWFPEQKKDLFNFLRT